MYIKTKLLLLEENESKKMKIAFKKNALRRCNQSDTGKSSQKDVMDSKTGYKCMRISRKGKVSRLLFIGKMINVPD